VRDRHFLKIKAQNFHDPAYKKVQLELENVYKKLEVPNEGEIMLGGLGIAKILDSLERCRILDYDTFTAVAFVEFMDLGVSKRMDYRDIRMLPLNSCLATTRSFASEFILAEIVLHNYQSNMFERLQDRITNKVASMNIIGRVSYIEKYWQRNA
jgi:hypothetical protein